MWGRQRPLAAASAAHSLRHRPAAAAMREDETTKMMSRDMLNRISRCAVAGLLITASYAAWMTAQQPQIRTPRQTPPPVNPDFSKMEVQTLKVQGNIYLIAGAGGNIAVQAGDDGIL